MDELKRILEYCVLSFFFLFGIPAGAVDGMQSRFARLGIADALFDDLYFRRIQRPQARQQPHPCAAAKGGLAKMLQVHDQHVSRFIIVAPGRIFAIRCVALMTKNTARQAKQLAAFANTQRVLKVVAVYKKFLSGDTRFF